MTDGYILTPVTPELAACLDRVTSEPVDERPERVVARRGLTLVERNAARVEALLVGAAGDVTPHVAEVGDEFQSSEPSEEVPNPNDEHPEEER